MQSRLRPSNASYEIFGPLAFALFGLLLFVWRLGDPSRLNFDESYYVPAARALIELSHPANMEHPPLGKLLIGLSLTLLGDHPVGWRVASACCGAVSLYATIKLAMIVGDRLRAGLLAGVFALTSQLLFVMSRVAMLDIFLAAFLMLALWMLVSALRSPRANSARIALSGIFFGLAIASKWSGIPVLLGSYLCGLTYLLRRNAIERGAAGETSPSRRREGLLLSFWLLVPCVLTYLVTFLPLLFLKEGAVGITRIIPLQFDMLRRQRGAMAPHPYQSAPWQWLLDLRPIWFFYEPLNGHYRGVLLVGNPVTMWSGLLALPGAAVLGLRKGTCLPLLLAGLYVLSVGWWYVSFKPVMFYHYYLFPSLLMCVSLGYVASWALDYRHLRAISLAITGASGVVFVYFYPILSAVPLASPGDFTWWMWFESWR